jgi:Tfp pilus assembly protein PilO
MKASDRRVLMALPVVALIAAFWFLILSPKREEASSLQGDVAQLESEVTAAQQLADAAEQARKDFPEDYQKVVTLGKAMPQDDDTASLFARLGGISRNAGVEFVSLELKSTSETPEAPPPSPTGETPSVAEPPPEAGDASATVAAAPATESAAAALPIGAAVGPAGLPVMPYSLKFRGDFFHVADFIHGLDSGVSTGQEKVTVDGRLITIDGFSLKGDAERGFPFLDASFAVTTYLAPETQGLTAGATPSGPAPVTTPADGSVTTEPTSSTGATP